MERTRVYAHLTTVVTQSLGTRVGTLHCTGDTSQPWRLKCLHSPANLGLRQNKHEKDTQTHVRSSTSMLCKANTEA